ncbi:MAG: hypothetical protein HY675_09490 [Chloroflexi bacterium]|nr:hypothetical protein [Chloroflexota bacterium]
MAAVGPARHASGFVDGGGFAPEAHGLAWDGAAAVGVLDLLAEEVQRRAVFPAPVGYAALGLLDDGNLAAADVL